VLCTRSIHGSLDRVTLEDHLAAAQARHAAALAALAPKHRGGEFEEYRAARSALLEAERALAAARGEEHAVQLPFPVRWNTGAPLPQVLLSDTRTFVIFVVETVDPDWDGTYVTVKSAASDEAEDLALVEFHRCTSARLGSPNDEVFSGHPLSGRGLEGYTAQLVRNSRWLGELEAINRLHRGYRPEWWAAKNHYVLWFHDNTFECIAESFTIERHRCSIPNLLAIAAKRLVE
jgi:hypothetical protein